MQVEEQCVRLWPAKILVMQESSSVRTQEALVAG